MIPHVVVDVGNTRIKWGRCSPDAVIDMASLPPDEPVAWEKQLDKWSLAPASRWVIAGVHPNHRERLAEWLRQRGEQVRIVIHLTGRTTIADAARGTGEGGDRPPAQRCRGQSPAHTQTRSRPGRRRLGGDGRLGRRDRSICRRRDPAGLPFDGQGFTRLRCTLAVVSSCHTLVPRTPEQRRFQKWKPEYFGALLALLK